MAEPTVFIVCICGYASEMKRDEYVRLLTPPEILSRLKFEVPELIEVRCDHDAWYQDFHTSMRKTGHNVGRYLAAGLAALGGSPCPNP